jgi:GT2 family glycosyltransferase
MYGEDNDYCQRVRWHGLKIGVALNTSAYHARGKTSSKNSWWQSIKRRSVLAESLLIMILKRVERPLLRRLLGSAYFVVKSSFVALRELDTVELFALWVAIVRTIPKLVAIMQHRQSSLQSGLHWIDP